MGDRRRINGRNIIGDLRSGMTDLELQTKYGLSAKGLCTMFEKLVDCGVVGHSELSGWSRLYSLRTRYKELQSYPRADLTVRVPIYDLGTGTIGVLRDISETGLRVAGVDVSGGQTRTFQIPVNEFMPAKPLPMIAVCKWAKTRSRRRQYVVAGFQIMEMPAKDRNTLQNFISILLLTKSGHWKTLSSIGDSHDMRRCGYPFP